MTRPRPHESDAGFTLIELLIVVAIIAAMAAVSLPQLMNYVKTARIRAAGSEVAGEVSVARLKAVSKNTRFGVAFVVASPSTYRFVFEDDQVPPYSSARVPVDTGITVAAQSGPLQVLPRGVTFSTDCPGFGTASDAGFRFNQLGGWCDPEGTGGTCPEFPSVGETVIENSATGGRICLRDDSTGLTRTVLVSPGGRVVTQ